MDRRVYRRALAKTDAALVGVPMTDATDYSEFADLNGYLFDRVGKAFRDSEALPAVDLFTIFIWKANRSKYKCREIVAKRGREDATGAALVAQPGDFERGAEKLRIAILGAQSDSDKLKAVLEFGFRMPMASAILSVLYPDVFTVYDYRVHQITEFAGSFGNRRWTNNCWRTYEAYRAKVIEAAPAGLSLRQADQYLWGKSFALDREDQSANGKPAKELEEVV